MEDDFVVVSLCLELVKPLQATFKISATGLRGRLHDAKILLKEKLCKGAGCFFTVRLCILTTKCIHYNICDVITWTQHKDYLGSLVLLDQDLIPYWYFI
jgi:hypothetical protein